MDSINIIFFLFLSTENTFVTANVLCLNSKQTFPHVRKINMHRKYK